MPYPAPRLTAAPVTSVALLMQKVRHSGCDIIRYMADNRTSFHKSNSKLVLGLVISLSSGRMSPSAGFHISLYAW